MILKNARHELFAQNLASGKTPSDAYVLAGFKADSGNASRLAAAESVRQRVTEILSAMAARSVKQANYTREWVVEQLIDVVLKAKEAADYSAANSALRLLGVERQMFVDRRESGAPGEFAQLQTTEQVLDAVRRDLGEEAVAALAAGMAKAAGVAEEQASVTEPSEPLPVRGPSDALN